MKTHLDTLLPVLKHIRGSQLQWRLQGRCRLLATSDLSKRKL